MKKENNKRTPWYVSKKCPKCETRLLTDSIKIFCIECDKSWFSIDELLKEETDA